MRDSDVRAAVRRALAKDYGDDPSTRIVEEMGIWSGTVRVDVAVINGELHGFELKSERDTLERLEAQRDLYNQVFDRVTLVAASRHLDTALRRIPEWWGVTRAVQEEDGSVRLRQVRRAKRNRHQVPLQCARLLWRSEALSILERYGIDRGFRSRPAEAISERLALHLPIRVLVREVRETLKVRPTWLGQAVGNQ
jgi:hypothetical protein